MKNFIVIKKAIEYSFILIVVLFFGACNNPRYINAPSAHNAAFLKQRGDFKISVAASGNPLSLIAEDNDQAFNVGIDGQAAVAVTDHFVITAGVMDRTERNNYSNDDLFKNESRNTRIEYKRTIFDIGAGFFTPVSGSKKVYFNGVAGVGFGKIQSKDDADPYSVERSRIYNADVLKYYFNPSFNFFFNNYFRMSVAPRVSVLSFNNINTTYSQEEETMLDYGIARKKAFFLFEPSLLLQTGFRNNDWLKLDFGFNFSSNPFTFTSSDESHSSVYPKFYNLNSRNIIFSLGLSFYPRLRK